MSRAQEEHDALAAALRESVRHYLADQDPQRLAEVLMAGLAHEELKPGPGGLVYEMMDRLDFVIDPLPNLLFTRDSSVCTMVDVGSAVMHPNIADTHGRA